MARLRKTFADYVVIALSPLLIMVLVGSLAFFLLELGYHGRWESRLRWMTFWFTLASVLVSRISIEQGYAKASVYGLGLGAAVGLLSLRLIGFSPYLWLVLALIWWCTSKLTWDSTLIDDDDDSSGQGLLQAGGLAGETEATPADGKKKHRKKTHAPGVWIVYFSLAALPLFGVGQLFLRADAPESRAYGFKLLWLYTAAALCLLMTTSFLGLRRYLRQRQLRMPPMIAFTWIAGGSVIAAAVLALCLILPRPDGVYSMQSIQDQLESLTQKASDKAVLGGQSAEGEGRRIGEGKKEGEGQAKAKGGGNENTPESPQAQSQAGGAEAGGNQSGPKEAAKNGGDGEHDSTGKSQSSAQSRTEPGTSEAPANSWWRWLIIGVVIALLLLGVWVFRRQLLGLWQQWTAFWQSLFGRKASETNATAKEAAPLRPFSEFRNPFVTGMAERWSADELVRYSFDALQAWAHERNWARLQEQTPQEFARVMADQMPGLAEDLAELGFLYTRLAYASQPPPAECEPAMERIWKHLSAIAPRR